MATHWYEGLKIKVMQDMIWNEKVVWEKYIQGPS